jgi:hypothetical protein
MAIISARIIGAKQIEKALLDAFEVWAEEDINDAHWDDQFRDMDEWEWPGETRRKNGEVVDSPRDIYDLGDLYKSGVESFRVYRGENGAEANWHWDAVNTSGEEYAWYVHEGTRFMPGRPFTDDISIPSSFFRKAPGKALQLRVQEELNKLNAR